MFALQEVNIEYRGFPFKFIFPLQYSVTVSAANAVMQLHWMASEDNPVYKS